MTALPSIPGDVRVREAPSGEELGLQDVVLGRSAPLGAVWQPHRDPDGAEHEPLEGEPEGEQRPAHDERVGQVAEVAEADVRRRRRPRVQLGPRDVGRQPEVLAPEGLPRRPPAELHGCRGGGGECMWIQQRPRLACTVPYPPPPIALAGSSYLLN